MKHLEVRQKYSAARRIFSCLLGVSTGDETLRLMLDILPTYVTVQISSRIRSLQQVCVSILRTNTLRAKGPTFSSALLFPEDRRASACRVNSVKGTKVQFFKSQSLKILRHREACWPTLHKEPKVRK